MTVPEYLTHLLSPLLSKPDSLRITETHDSMGILLTVDVSKEDMGTVVCKQGENAKAIRNLVRIVGMKQNARVAVKINEPADSTYKPKA